MAKWFVSIPLFLLAGAPLRAQVRPADVGMVLVTRAGQAGNLCRGFSCGPAVATAQPNEVVRLELRGPKRQPFWLFVAPQATWCVRIPGIQNHLALTPPIFLVAAGTLTLPDRILACPGGLQVLRFPALLPRGASLVFQAAIVAPWPRFGAVPTLTRPVTLRV